MLVLWRIHRFSPCLTLPDRWTGRFEHFERIERRSLKSGTGCERRVNRAIRRHSAQWRNYPFKP
jgi:hypothetical protein